MNTMNSNPDLHGHSYLDINEIIGNIWKAITRLGWIVLLLALTGGAMGYYRGEKTYIPRYTSKATFAVSGSSTNTTILGSRYFNNATALQMAQTYKYLMTSSIVRTIIAQDLGLVAVPGSITAEVVPETNLMILQATAFDSQTAYAIMNSVINRYAEISEIMMYNTTIQLIESPKAPSLPDNPSSSMSQARRGVALGAGAGILLMIVISVVRRTVTRSEHIIRELNMACIGIIPRVTFKKRSKAYNKDILINNAMVGFRYKESIRALRTKVEAAMKDKACKIIVVTSTLPNEGKTLLSANLALALALNGKSVVLVDGDLRSPSIGLLMNRKKEGSGILDVLSGKASIEQALIPLDVEGFAMLMGTSESEEAAEMLSSDRMERMLDELRKKAEYIIIDTPPVGLMTDASVLSVYADGVIIVIRQDYAPTADIVGALENLSHSHPKILGCVLNDVKGSEGERGSGKYGRYGDYSEEREFSN